MDPNQKRIFLGLKVSEEANTKVAQTILKMQELAEKSQMKISWVKPENLHLTLKFIGSFPISETDRLAHEVATSFEKFSKFELSLRGMGAFPNETHARVIWVGLKQGSEVLENLAHDVDGLMESFGIKREPHPYSPHLTVGRVKERARVGEILFPFKFLDFGISSITEAVLFESVLNSETGTRYIELSHFPFRG